MRAPWEADIQLTARDACLLIERQFPDLAPAQLVVYGAGCDNLAFLVNQRFVFRFPRRLVAAGLLEREVRILPLLAPHLPLRIPVPGYVGAPTAGYPHAFAGYPLLPGRTACQCSCSDRERAALAPALAHFLAALHGLPIGTETLQWAPRDELARADLRQRAPKVKERILANVAELDGRDVGALLDCVDELASAPGSAGALCWVHGDFYSRHLVLDGANRAVGVIDWGDVHVGDRALDLSIAFSFLPPAVRPRFRQLYGEIDDATWRRARFRAIDYGAILVEYGTTIADAAIRALGEYALRSAPVGE